MKIQIVTAVGEGSTSLASFDCALQNAGVSNYNLIPLSSVIPPNSTIEVVEKYVTPEEDFGKRLYVVKAEQRSEKVGECIGAGIGWYQLEDGRGFFVEHEAKGLTREEVNENLSYLIENTLRDMCTNRNIKFQPNDMFMLRDSKISEKQHECQLVLAVYQHQEWDK